MFRNKIDARALGAAILGPWGYTADEAEQEVLVTAWELLQKEPDKEYSSFEGYVVYCLRNKEIDRLRKRSLMKGHLCLTEEDNLVANEDFYSGIEKFLDRIKCLDEGKQLLLIEKFVYGSSEAEMAKKFRVKKGTIKSRVNRSLELLRKEHG